MKDITITRYTCEVCETTYDLKDSALQCERRPVTEDKGVKVGDEVLITSGEGAGERARVAARFVYGANWGPERYWHTVGLTADLINSWGTRQLTFKDYKLVETRAA